MFPIIVVGSEVKSNTYAIRSVIKGYDSPVSTVEEGLQIIVFQKQKVNSDKISN